MPGGDNNSSTNRECEVTKNSSTTKQQNIVLMQDFKSTSFSDDATGAESKPLTMQSAARMCRFPKLEECAHFHYERVQLGTLDVCLVNERLEQFISKTDSLTAPSSLQSFSLNNTWFLIKVTTHQTEPFYIKRSFDNMKLFDEMLHRCVYDRKISGLCNLNDKLHITNEQEIECLVSDYMERFSKIASDSLTCGTILTWLQLDNKGRRLPLADDDTMRSINTPAVGAAYGVRRYQAQANDEISIELGDMISVIDMPTPAESVWWRGKKSNWQKSHYEVGFFPQSCVATIGDKVPRHFPLPAPVVAEVDVTPTKPVLRKHGKLIAFFRSFILSRPSRRRLKQTGIYRERVFSCDLSEHLLNSSQEIPLVLKCCTEFIEASGIVDGIYRLSGITSNIQRLRQAFDEERVPDLGNPEMRQDIHAVSSLLKMYFRELPNPLCTYQLYENFVEAIQKKGDNNERLRLMRETVMQLPPPHYRTLKYLIEHLYRVSQYSERTGMTDKNLAIVWAPNLLRSTSLESGGVAALQGVGVQAVVTEFLIRYSNEIFNEIYAPTQKPITSTESADNLKSIEIVRADNRIDCDISLTSQHELEQNSIHDRPKSINACGAKLISLEEAQERQSHKELSESRSFMPLSLASNMGSYIEVGGGPASLPEKYHTVISVPRSWQKRKQNTWRSIFRRNPSAVTNGLSHKRPDTDNIKDIENIGSITKTTTKDNTICDGKLLKEQKTKSVEFFDTNKLHDNTERYAKGGDICLRSGSIDSLRTIGHSRSASHDSYFDMLQSPLHHNKASPSRELNELYMNFYLEEPEMRIFSESESLVNSPRVDKENLDLNYISLDGRRVLRTRPDDYFSRANNVNPSPKKQPRLNLTPSVKKSDIQTIPDTNSGKRYKFEDQFPDIQYIDCNTPQHITHKTPKPNSKRDVEKITVTKQTESSIKETYFTRNSYPNMQSRITRGETRFAKERLSYPLDKINSLKNMPEQDKPESSRNVANHEPYGMLRMRRDTTDNGSGKILSLHDITTEVPNSSSKVSMTPSSPGDSPHYILLDGDTSSENRSSINTPQYEATDDIENLALKHNISTDSLTYEETPMKTSRTDIIDKRALKKELSLNLVEITAKPLPQVSIGFADFAINSDEDKPKKTDMLVLSSPNSSIKTDNTSASITPSEFGYQSLYRQSSAYSLQDMEAEIPVLANLESPMSTRSLLSPMQKSTISITYNTRSEKLPEILPNKPNTDDNSIYEQVNVFRNSVSDLNRMIKPKDEQYEKISPTIAEEIVDNCHLHKDVKQCASKYMSNDNYKTKHLANDKRYSPKTTSGRDSLYENVKLRKPQNVYVNVLVTDVNISDGNEIKQLELITDNNKVQNFSVKELANKFENSKSERNSMSSMKINLNDKLERKVEQRSSVKNLTTKPKLHNVHKITRSLDEAAFQREFNPKQQEQHISNSSTKLQDELANLVTQRRKSFDFTRPKSLNPPKTLPVISASIAPILEQKPSMEEQPLTGVLIVSSFEPQSIDLSSSSILSDVKLDRERIDRIKEERRQQLMKKYGLKSRSKTELNADIFNEEFLKARSKSRGDISQIVQIDGHFLKSSDLNLFGSNTHVNKLNCKSQLLWQNSEQKKKVNTECNLHDVNKTNVPNELNENPLKGKTKNYKQTDVEKNSLHKQNADTMTSSSSSSNSENNLTNHLTNNKRNQDITTQFSIRDVTAMFESRSVSQQ